MIIRVIIILFCSILVSFLLPDVMAQVPSFDQSTYVYEHSGRLTVEDSNASSNPVNATITTLSGDVTIYLYQIDNSNIYRSYLIYFSQTAQNEDGKHPVVNVEGLNSIEAKYKGNSASATIEGTSGSLILGDDYFSPPHEIFEMENYPNCTKFGGDNDADYICNDWETGEYLVNLKKVDSDYHLPPCDSSADYISDKLGKTVCPDPNVKDIYIEIDYMKSHSPNVVALEKVVEAFRNAPVENLNEQGSPHDKYPTGINLHIFIDEEIKHVNQLYFDETITGGFHDIKARDYGLSNAINPPEQVNGTWAHPPDKTGKAQIFYYYIWAHEQATETDSSGIAEPNGNDGAVTLGKFVGQVGNTDQQAGTFMHELGHNIGLNHGGGSDNVDNCKPNLLSVMTYSRQFSDLLDRPLDYSRQAVGTMNDTSSLGQEDQLNNTAGISGYPNCPFVSSTIPDDPAFDGIADVCDEEIMVSQNITVKQDTSLFGNLTINSGGVLTINPGTALDYDVKNHKILIESGGELMVKTGGALNGNSMIDSNGYYENAPLVFGDSNGNSTVENSYQDEITWPSYWQGIRFIKDSFGNYICPLPEGVENESQLVPVNLTSFDQWSMIDLTRKNQFWTGGRDVIRSDTIPTSFDNSQGMVKFIAASLQTPRTFFDTPSENVTITIKPGSGIAKMYGNDLTCDDWFCPSYVKIDVGTKVTWINEDETEFHSITSAFWDKPDPKPKFDYQGEFNNHIFMKGQTFEHTFENTGTYQYGCIYHPWMKGVICVGPECPIFGEEGETQTPGERENFPRFETNGKWCISKKNAQNQIDDDPRLEMDRAPLCSNPELNEEKELTVENVRAARSVNLDKVLVMIAKLNPITDFENPSDKAKLIQELQDIRKNILKDKMPEALEGYINFADSVNVMVTSKTSKNQILEVVDRNIETTTRSIPEFETVSILVLIISTITIIALSRKISFNSINNQSF